jgi:hypothetical protein
MDIVWLIISLLAFTGSVYVFVNIIKNKTVDKFTLVMYGIIVMMTFFGWVIEDIINLIS